MKPGFLFLLFKSFFSDNFLSYFEEHSIINLLTKRIKLNLLFTLSYLNSNFALTQGYLNPALNNPALKSIRRSYIGIQFHYPLDRDLSGE